MLLIEWNLGRRIMGWKSYSDELDARPQPIVAIPFRRFWIILGFTMCLAVRFGVPVVLLLWMAARQWLRPDKVQGKWDLGAVDLTVWIQVFLPWAAVAVTVVAAMFWPWPPEFAVFKDGIKLPTKRHSPKRSNRDPWSCGFYSWSDVNYCRWSRYQKGVLAVHLKAVEHCEDVVIWETWSPATTKLPPMIFDYHVPERYRANVEAAIRAFGKWAE